MIDATDLLLCKYMDAVRYRYFNPVIRGIFPQIGDLGRRILAMQRFISALDDPKRGQSWLDSRQAMSADQHAAWRHSAAHQTQNEEIKAIQARFLASNPDHKLIAGSQFRSLDQQIANWRKNGTVGFHAPRMRDRVRLKLASEPEAFPDLGSYLSESGGLLALVTLPRHTSLLLGNAAQLAALGITQTPSPIEAVTESRNAAVQRFAEWLGRQTTGAPKLMVATPGLSSHGVGQAIDFQVHKRSGGIVLGAGQADLWRSSGFAVELADAVRPSRYFTGPLTSPDEPWHWTFDPNP